MESPALKDAAQVRHWNDNRHAAMIVAAANQGTAMPPFHAMRTILFVPGSRPDFLPKAAGAGADALVLDLEDSVAPQA